MPKGENVGAIYVDVGADLAALDASLAEAQKRLTAFAQGKYEVKLAAVQNAIAQSQTAGNRAKILVEPALVQNWQAAVAKTLVEAKVEVPVQLSLSASSVDALKQSILQGMAGFVVPVQVQATGQPTSGGAPTGPVTRGAARGSQRGDVAPPAATAAPAAAPAPGAPRTAAPRATASRPRQTTAAVAPAAAPSNDDVVVNLQERATAIADELARRQAARGRASEVQSARKAIFPKGQAPRYVSEDRYREQLRQQIERRVVRELLPRELERRGVTADELSQAPPAGPAALLSVKPTGPIREAVTDISMLGVPEDRLTRRALFAIGSEARPGGRRRAVRRYGDFYEPGPDTPAEPPRPLHGPRETATELTSTVREGGMTPAEIAANRASQARIEAERTGEPVVRRESGRPAVGAYGSSTETYAAGLRGVAHTRVRLGGRERTFDVSEELAQKLQDRDRRKLVRDALTRLQQTIERREGSIEGLERAPAPVGYTRESAGYREPARARDENAGFMYPWEGGATTPTVTSGSVPGETPEERAARQARNAARPSRPQYTMRQLVTRFRRLTSPTGRTQEGSPFSRQEAEQIIRGVMAEAAPATTAAQATTGGVELPEEVTALLAQYKGQTIKSLKAGGTPQPTLDVLKKARSLSRQAARANKPETAAPVPGGRQARLVTSSTDTDLIGALTAPVPPAGGGAPAPDWEWIQRNLSGDDLTKRFAGQRVKALRQQGAPEDLLKALHTARVTRNRTTRAEAAPQSIEQQADSELDRKLARIAELEAQLRGPTIAGGAVDPDRAARLAAADKRLAELEALIQKREARKAGRTGTGGPAKPIAGPTEPEMTTGVASPSLTLSSTDPRLSPEARATIAAEEAKVKAEETAAAGVASKKLKYRERPVVTGFREPSAPAPAAGGREVGPVRDRGLGEAVTPVVYSSATDPLMRRTEEQRERAELRTARNVAGPQGSVPAFAQAKREVNDLFSLISTRAAYDKSQATAARKAAVPLPVGEQAQEALIERGAARVGREVPRVPTRRVRTIEDFQAEAERRAQEQQERATLPERAPSTAFAQVFARLTGTKGRFEEAQQTARAERSRLEVLKDQQTLLAEQATALRDRRDFAFEEIKTARERKTLTKADHDAFLGINKTYQDGLNKLNEQNAAVEKQSAVVGKAEERVRKAGGGLASAAQVAALFVGAKAFLVLSQAIDQAAGAAGAALAPVVEQLTGFADTSKRVTSALRDQTVANRGNVDASIAAAAATAGLSAQAADFLQSSGLGNRVQGQAAGIAAVQQRDLFRANLSLGGRFDKSLFQGTGGVLNSSFLAEQLGGTPGVIESLNKTLGPINRQASGIAPSFGQDLNKPFPIAIAQAINAAFGAEGTILGQGNAGLASNATEQNQAIRTQIEAINNVNSALDRQAEYAGESGKQFQYVAAATKEQREAMVESARTISAEAEKEAQRIADRGSAVTGAGGENLRGQDFGVFAQQLAKGLTIQDPTLLIREQQRQFNAEVQGMDERLRLQMQLIPGQLAIELAGQPQLPAATGIRTEGLGAGQRAEVNQQLQRVTELQAQTTDEAAKGMKNLEDIVRQSDEARLQAYNFAPPTAQQEVTPGRTRAGADLATERAQIQQRAVPPGFQAQLPIFQSLVKELQQYGKELAQVQAALANRQAAVALKEYDQQIILVKRNLNDALALAGKRAEIDGLTVGHLERQQVLLQRQSQELSFQAQTLQLQLQQRRINFQVAAAGFQAPGETSEERRARIEEAKIEADYAQRLLNIQKQQLALGKREFTVAVKIQDRGFLRQIQELRFQLASLERGRALTVFTAASERHIAALQRRIAQTNARIQAIIETATGIANRIIEIGVSVAAATGNAVRRVVQSAYRVLTRALDQFQRLAEAYRHATTVSSPGATSGGKTASGPERGSASGALFMTSGTTNVGIAGEAGTEAVAIIRNPRPISLGGGGGGGGGGTMVTIAFNGTVNVRSDDDIKQIAYEVEKVFQRRGSLIGMRSLTTAATR